MEEEIFLNEKEYFINCINEQNIIKSVKNLTQQNDECERVRVSWSCQCSNNKQIKIYTPRQFREYLIKNENHFSTMCLNCNKECQILNISFEPRKRPSFCEPRTEYFINYMNKNVDKIILRLNCLIRDSEYRVYGTWSCQCEEWEKFFTPEKFREYLGRAKDHSFWKTCLKCNKKCQISSFNLLMKQEQSIFGNLRSITEIVRHLIDNNNYIVYGYWICREWKCRHEPECKSELNCRYKWQTRHRWQCQHEPKCESLCNRRCQDEWWRWSRYRYEWWSRYRYWRYNKSCERKCMWSMERCRYRMCNCQQRRLKHDWKCQEMWLDKNEWQCKHDQKCKNERECRREWQCSNEWKSCEYTQELLKEFLEKTPREQYNFFTKECEECGEKSLITSFHLYTQEDENNRFLKENNTPNLTSILTNSTIGSTLLPVENRGTEGTKEVSQSPTIEIICHLVWNNHYRVFGEWMCKNRYCFRSWPSSYTWIKLRNFIDKTPAESLNWADFYMQSCKKCKNSKNRLLKYEHLKEADVSNRHKEDLCKKCRYGEICHQTGTYFG